MLVVGVEGEGYWSSLKQNTSNANIPLPDFFSSITNNWQVKNKSDFDIAVRFGFAVDRALVYGKGGFAWGNFSFSHATSLAPVGRSHRNRICGGRSTRGRR